MSAASEAGAGVILVVDDSELMAELIAGTLEDEGHTVVVATCGEVALDLARQHRLDVAVCDLNMPGLDGLEVMRRLAALDAAVPVIMLTGDGEPGTVLQVVQRGAFAFVQKTGDLTPLVEAVARALTLRRATPPA